MYIRIATTKRLSGILKREYTCARMPSSISLPFRYPVQGQYMPTVASNRQKIQKVDCSDLGWIEKKKQRLAVARMATSRVEYRTISHLAIMLKAREAARADAMKLAKMRPYGSAVVVV